MTLLFTSLLTPTEILTGKLFASLSMILGVVVISMPIGAICSLSGGIGPQLLLSLLCRDRGCCGDVRDDWAGG